MAIENTTPGRRLKTTVQSLPFKGPDAAKAYEDNASLIYGVIRSFLPEPLASEALRKVAVDLALAIPELGYDRYSKLVCLKAVFEQLKKYSVSLQSATPITNLTFEEVFCLLLRDKFGLRSSDIGAVTHTSEGSIRTRLQQARSRQFPEKNTPSHLPDHSHGAHSCIDLMEAIEDWDPLHNEAAETGAPPEPLMTKAKMCGRCNQAIKQRSASLRLFRNLPNFLVPDELKRFPITPVVLKEGKKFRLNWSSAPWYLKAITEGIVATVIVVGVVLAVPTGKRLYELWLERRFDLYSVAELAAGLGGHSDTGAQPSSPQAPVAAPDQTGVSPLGPLPAADTFVLKVKSEFLGRDAEVPLPDRYARVLIKIDEPESVKGQVLQILSAAQYTSADSEEPAGAGLPGGILFDIYVPLKNYKSVLKELQHISNVDVLMTHSRQRGRAGHARMKIWLQRI